MKTFFVSFILLFISVFVSAQAISFGAKAGFGFSSKPDVSITNTTISNIYSNVKNQSTGFHIGVFSQINLGSLYVQPEAYFTSFKTSISSNEGDFEIKQKRIDIPVLLGTKFLDMIRVNAGPVLSYNVNDDIDLNGIRNLTQDNFTVGLQFGAGVDLGKINMDVRYEKALSSKLTEFVKNNSNFQVDSRPNQFLVSVGYTF